MKYYIFVFRIYFKSDYILKSIRYLNAKPCIGVLRWNEMIEWSSHIIDKIFHSPRWWSECGKHLIIMKSSPFQETVTWHPHAPAFFWDANARKPQREQNGFSNKVGGGGWTIRTGIFNPGHVARAYQGAWKKEREPRLTDLSNGYKYVSDRQAQERACIGIGIFGVRQFA